MRIILAIVSMLWSSLAWGQAVCTGAGLLGLQATLCPLHVNIHAALPPGGQVTLSTLQTQIRSIISAMQTANIISLSTANTLNNQTGTGGTAGLVLTNPATALSLRTLLLNIVNDAGILSSDLGIITNEINGALPSGNTIGISADTTRKVLKDVAWRVLRWNLGANANGLQYYNNSYMYSDAVMAASGNFGMWDCGSSACTVDPSGAPSPASGTAQTYFSNLYPTANSSNPYTLSWTGTGSITCSGAVGGAANCSVGSVTTTSCPAPAYLGGGTTQCHTAPVTLTQVPPATPGTNNAFGLLATLPVTNVHLMLPSSLTYHGNSMWSLDFAQRIGALSELRFLDPMNVNLFYNIQNWNQRKWGSTAAAANCNGGVAPIGCVAGNRTPINNTAPPVDCFGTGPSPPALQCSYFVPIANNSTGSLMGMAYEDIINIANTFNIDVWVHVPLAATDNYVCRLARLFAFGESGASDTGNNCSATAAACAGNGSFGCDETPINSISHMYIEVNNEMWNSSFDAFSQAYCWGNVGNNYEPQNFGNAMTQGACPYASIGTAPPSTFLLDQLTLPTVSTSWWASAVSAGGGPYPAGIAIQLVLDARNWNYFGPMFNSLGRLNQVRVVFNSQYISGCQDAMGQFGAWIAFGGPGQIPSWNGSSVVAGPINQFLWGVAFAPYWNVSSSTVDGSGGTIAGIVTDLETNVLTPTGTNSTPITTCISGTDGANHYGINTITYEGGEGLVNGTALDAIADLTYPASSGWRNVYVQSFTTWDTLQGLAGRRHLYNQYTLEAGQSGGAAGNSNWGLLISSANHGSYKYDGMMNLGSKVGDVNLDGVVDQNDCAILMSNFNATPPNSGTVSGLWWRDGDLNGDGVVNATDGQILNAVIEGAKCPCPGC